MSLYVDERPDFWRDALPIDITASEAVAAQTSQTQQAAAQVGIKTAIQKDQEVVSMLQKAQDDLKAVTPTRGNNVNVNA